MTAPAEKLILKKFVADKVDLILTFPTEVSLEAKAAVEGTKIPLIFANANIEGVDLVKGVPEPGGNITGVRYPGPDLAIKRLESWHEMVPNARRIWIFYQRGYPIVASQLEVLRPVAVSLGVALTEKAADNAAEIHAILQKQVKTKDIGMDAILIIAEPLITTTEAYDLLGKFAAEHKIPVGGALSSAVNDDSLFGVSTENIAVGRQAVILADKIFKGKPAGTY